MFTGIIEESGIVQSGPIPASGGRLVVSCRTVLGDLTPGDSIAVSGVCLTATAISDDSFRADVSPETLRRSNLGCLRPGDGVNLERAMTPASRMGGHFVQGHVDAVGSVEEVRPDGSSLWMRLRLPPDLMPFVAPKGFIALDGISLTIVDVFEAGISCMLVPFTQSIVGLAAKKKGSTVNVEVDILAKYALNTSRGGDISRFVTGLMGGGGGAGAGGGDAGGDGDGESGAAGGLERALDALRSGRPIIVLDDATRENEGDLIAAAQFADAELVNFMARNACGLICVSMTDEALKRLGIPMMVPGPQNGTPFQSPFTVSVEAASGVTTGISAADRARTIRLLARPETTSSDLVMPGHVFPLRANPAGLAARRGHTEAGVELMKLAGLEPAAVICEIMNSDGTMARRNDLICFAERHDLVLLTMDEVARAGNPSTPHEKPLTVTGTPLAPGLVERVDEALLPTRFGPFKVVAFVDEEGLEHLLLEFGDTSAQASPIVRVHSECLTGDALGSVRCDCGDQLQAAMTVISEAGSGALVYLRQEGRGIGLANKIRAYAIQDTGYDTVEANLCLGFEPDLRSYAIAAAMLRDRGIDSVRLLTNNPQKVRDLELGGVRVTERIAHHGLERPQNASYLKTKASKLAHHIEND